MATFKTLHAEGSIPMPIPFDQAVVAERMEYAIGAALGAEDIIILGFLPEDCVPTDLVVDTDAMGGSCAAKVGLLNADGDDLEGTPWVAAAALAAAGGVRADAAGLRAMARLPASDKPRPVAMYVNVLGTATTGKVGVTLQYRAV